MFQNYLKIALRNQIKRKGITVINILGLAIGMAVAMLIFNYVSFEFSFDKSHSKHDRIYRVESRFYEDDRLTDDWATSSFGYGSAISREMTGIEDFVRIGVHNPEQIVSYKEKRNRENGIAYTGPSFFSVFDFRLKEGLASDQLNRPNTVIISEEVAKRYFIGEDPIGKVMTFASGTSFVDCEVTGVIEDFPKNSHIHFNYLISYETLPDWMKEFWYKHEAYTYLLLSPGKNPKEIEAGFPAMAEKYKTGDALRNKKWAVDLVPLDDIHLNPQKQYENEIKGNKGSLITLIVIAIVILLTAWINYINLTTARSMERTKDIGIRKVAGATRLEIIWQFLFESLLVNLASVILATILVLLLKHSFNQIIGENIGILIFKQPVFWLSALAVLITGIVLSGFYPGFIMTRMNPFAILKENRSGKSSAGTTRQVLVVFQFAASLFLICGTFIISRQVKYMQKQDLGADINQTIVIKYPVSREDLDHRVEMFAENLKNEPGIKSVTLAGSVPGMEVAFFASNRLQGEGEMQHRLYEMLTVDDDFIETFDLDLLAGRSFRKGFGNEIQNLLINEAAIPYLGLAKPEDAIGKKVLLEGEADPVTIIGVVKNWHQRGLENAYTPIMILRNGRLGWVPPKFIAIRTTGNQYESALNLINSRWNSYFPEASFDYFFLDRFFDNQYKSDRRFESIVNIFTVLAFFISVLGLWALSAFSASKRVKEMGVRKILGAPVWNIVYLFLEEIVILILIAFLVATPISFFLMKNWLLNYAFRTNISLWIYLAGIMITLLIALFTVCLQVWKTVTRNPVEALRYE
ncbi:MAG TPA: ABC transporter permease [Bacteroidales bacterium]|nr:ABC transporter permease [Bacteroidales bacterium]HPT22518.1 ABC transporter permease [Bacteroidales bacterium]